MRYMFPLTESLSRWPVDGREDEKLWLFETWAHNLLRERGAEEVFLLTSPATHCKGSIRKNKRQ
jgi:hypothetical protein